MQVINESGYSLDFSATVSMMDDDLREELHLKLAPCTEQEFFSAYEAAHEARFGEPWELSRWNPTW